MVSGLTSSPARAARRAASMKMEACQGAGGVVVVGDGRLGAPVAFAEFALQGDLLGQRDGGGPQEALGGLAR